MEDVQDSCFLIRIGLSLRIVWKMNSYKMNPALLMWNAIQQNSCKSFSQCHIIPDIYFNRYFPWRMPNTETQYMLGGDVQKYPWRHRILWNSFTSEKTPIFWLKLIDQSAYVICLHNRLTCAGNEIHWSVVSVPKVTSSMSTSLSCPNWKLWNEHIFESRPLFLTCSLAPPNPRHCLKLNVMFSWVSNCGETLFWIEGGC